MSINTTESKHKSLEGVYVGPGPYLARVVNHLDSTLMGGLEVLLYEGGTSDSSLSAGAIPVYYMSPFWGSTSSAFEGNNAADFNDVQKSYGMWMVPPDIGTCVMVMFVRGMANAGYWIGCVPDTYQNHMVPGIAATRAVAMTDEQQRKYGTTALPVGEFLKRSRDLSGGNVDKFTKPVHPFADRLLAQGLILDDIRGITSSSARREHPSSVFGISTPGPIDESKGAKTGQIGFAEKSTAYVSRLGGSQFVMDDGDKQGLNELVRIRTRTGHQILLHNSSDLIYIANAAGSAWIELTGQGKIDIYAQDSVSIHSEGDFNLRADRDFNIEAGRSLNLVSGTDLRIESAANIDAIAVRRIEIAASQDIHLSANTDMFIGAQSDLHLLASGDNIYISSGSNTNIKTGNDFRLGSANVFVNAATNLNLNGASAIKMGSAGAVSVNANTTLSLAATGRLNILGKQSAWLTSPDLEFNAGQATAGPAPDLTPPDTPTAPEAPTPLPRFNLPNRSAGAWSDGKFMKASDLVSIMTRVPTHEPWDQHESVNPERFKLDNTNVENTKSNTFPSATVVYARKPATSPPKPTGDKEIDNLAAFLWTVRRAEGTDSVDGYKTQYTFAIFDVENPGLPSGVTAPTGFMYYKNQKLGIYKSNSYSPAGGKFVVVGDSLAVGIGGQIPGCIKVATEGISSAQILKNIQGNTSIQNADVAIVSAGANDGWGISGNIDDKTTVANIQAIRSALNAKKYVWVLPYNRNCARAVAKAIGGDASVDLPTIIDAGDGIHPKSYVPVAKKAIELGGMSPTIGAGGNWVNRSYKFADHPRVVLGPTKLRSSAAGAYQFMPDTWDDCVRALKLSDFSPENQDKACIWLIQTRNALDDVKQGRFYVACDKVKGIWASFKGAGYKQRELDFKTLYGFYQEAGGIKVG